MGPGNKPMGRRLVGVTVFKRVGPARGLLPLCRSHERESGERTLKSGDDRTGRGPCKQAGEEHNNHGNQYDQGTELDDMFAQLADGVGHSTNRHSPHRGLHRPTAWHMMMATMEV